jgi:hypothetical protein
MCSRDPLHYKMKVIERRMISVQEEKRKEGEASRKEH